MRRIRGVVSVVLVLLVGCTTSGVRTTSMALNDKQQQKPATTSAQDRKAASYKASGIAYYLPMRYAKVTFTRQKADDKADEALATALAALKAAKTREATAKKAAAASKELVEAYIADGLEKADAPLVTAKAELVKARIEFTAATTALAAATETHAQAEAAAKSMAKAKLNNGWVDALKIQLLDPVPDTGRRYILQPQDSKLRSDDFKITTTSGGLLNTVNATLDDQSDEILIALAQSIASIYKPSLTEDNKYFENLTKSNDCDEYAYVPLVLEFIVDPASDADWTALGVSLNNSARVPCKTAKGAAKTFDFKFAKKTTESPAANHSGHITDNLMEGIVYRREIPIVIQVSESTTHLVSDVMLQVPNGAPAEVLELKATSFVTNTAVLGFTNGMLVSVDTKKPSPALVVAGLPAKIVTGVMGTVSDLLTARVNIVKQETSLTTEQTSLAKQRQALLDALEDLEEAEREAGE